MTKHFRLTLQVVMMMNLTQFKVEEGVMPSLPKTVEFSYEGFYLASHGGFVV